MRMRCYDPRKDDWVMSDNAALVVAEIVQRFGYDVDWDLVVRTADYVEELETHADPSERH